MDLTGLKNSLNQLRQGQNKTNSSDDSFTGEKVIELPVGQIAPDPDQPRKTFDDESIKELADDIKRNGLIQPVIVRKNALGQYVIVAGERRLRAYQKLGEPLIKVIVRDYGADQIGYIQIAENIKRSDLKFWELSDFVAAKVAAGEKKKEIANKLGISAQRIGELLAWQEAPEFLKEARGKLYSSRAAADLINLAQDEPEKVQDFVNNAEKISRSDVDEFKKSLEESKNVELAITTEPKPTESTETDTDVATVTITAYEHESGSTTAESDDTKITAFEPQSQGEESDQSAQAFAEMSEAEVLEEQEAQQEQLSLEQSDLSKIKKPLIIGSVEGREGYLQFKRRPTTDGMVWVKWENGYEEEILADRYHINRIIEE